MFYMNSVLEAVDCSGIDMSGCSDMYAMFQGDNALKAIKGAEDWDTSLVTNMNRAFSGCGRLRLGCSRWDVGKVSDHRQFNDGAPGVIAPAWAAGDEEGGGDVGALSLEDEEDMRAVAGESREEKVAAPEVIEGGDVAGNVVSAEE